MNGSDIEHFLARGVRDASVCQPHQSEYDQDYSHGSAHTDFFARQHPYARPPTPDLGQNEFSMPRLYDIDPGPECPQVVRMFVEIPKNSSNKYEYDGELNVFKMDRTLYLPLHYPGDYGFIPGTLSEDGDPLDILVLVGEPSYPGIMLQARPIGLLDMVDRDEPDQKILAVAHRDPRFDQLHSVDHVFAHSLREIEKFFAIYKELENKHVDVRGWEGREEAQHLIGECRQRYLKLH
jgi:inorganic pyrophosphatase